jgi:hypothetical protein
VVQTHLWNRGRVLHAGRRQLFLTEPPQSLNRVRRHKAAEHQGSQLVLWVLQTAGAVKTNQPVPKRKVKLQKSQKKATVQEGNR